MERRRFRDDLFDRDAHVTTITSLSAVALIFADAALDTNAGVLATLAWPLTVTALLALPATLAARLGRQVLLVGRKGRHGQRGTRSLARRRRERGRRDWCLCHGGCLDLGLGAVGARLDSLGGQLGHQGASTLLHRLRSDYAVVIWHNLVAVALERIVPVVILVALVRTVVTVHFMVVSMAC